MKMKVMRTPEYPEVDVIAKTHDSECGTIARHLIGRRYLTLDELPEQKCEGVETNVKLVRVERADAEVRVEFVGGVKSLATFMFFGAFTAENSENPGVTDVFTTDRMTVMRALACVERMSAAHPECDGQWKFTDMDGKRVFLRIVSTELNAKGMIGGAKPKAVQAAPEDGSDRDDGSED